MGYETRNISVDEIGECTAWTTPSFVIKLYHPYTQFPGNIRLSHLLICFLFHTPLIHTELIKISWRHSVLFMVLLLIPYLIYLAYRQAPAPVAYELKCCKSINLRITIGLLFYSFSCLILNAVYSG